jgi:hypothetical protein
MSNHSEKRPAYVFGALYAHKHKKWTILHTCKFMSPCNRMDPGKAAPDISLACKYFT